MVAGNSIALHQQLSELQLWRAARELYTNGHTFAPIFLVVCIIHRNTCRTCLNRLAVIQSGLSGSHDGFCVEVRTIPVAMLHASTDLLLITIFFCRPRAVSLAAGINGVTYRAPHLVMACTKISRRRALHRHIVMKAKQNEEQGSLQLPGACICCFAQYLESSNISLSSSGLGSMLSITLQHLGF